MKISPTELQRFVSALFVAADVPVSEADIVAECLVGSNLRGHDSHGVVRVAEYIGQLRDGSLKTRCDLKILSETASLLVADANFAFGPVQMQRLIDALLPKAQEQGIACGTMLNCGHVGRLGEWVERVSQEGFAGLMAVAAVLFIFFATTFKERRFIQLEEGEEV